MRQRKTMAIVAMAAAGALALSACGSSGGSSGSKGGHAQATGATSTVQNFGLGTKADSTGPAPAVPGAKKGGTVNDIEPAGLDYTDPAQIYVSN
jgi:peptide/nickel transport system substrate-binding protein